MAESSKRPPAGPRSNVERPSKDPKFTPRAGGFWTHDQRYDEAGSIAQGSQGNFRGNGRGRGGEASRGMRGNMRGRGRGAFGPGGRGGYNQASSGWGQELTESLDASGVQDEQGEKQLEMDKLEAELERKKEPQAKPEAESSRTEGEPDVQPRSNKWGHEGFESLQAVQQFQANRNFRGRGRGRGFPGAGESARLVSCLTVANLSSRRINLSTAFPPLQPCQPIGHFFARAIFSLEHLGHEIRRQLDTADR